MKNTSQSDMLEIIFADRNKTYGAYRIRREYPEYLMRAFLVSLAIIITLGIIPRLLPGLVGQEKIVSYNGPTFVQPSAKVKEEPPKPKMKIAAPPPVVKATFRYVPPKIEPDEKTPGQEQQLAMIEAMKELRPPGTTNTTGITEPGPPEFPDRGVLSGLDPAPGRLENPDTIMSPIEIQKMPSFPGGDAEMMRFIRDNLQYPSYARESCIQGTVALSFVVGKDGYITDLKILKDIGGTCGKEATRVVNMMPRWTPGEANGHPVKVRYTLPIRFRLQ